MYYAKHCSDDPQLVDFAIQRLFYTIHRHVQRPPHVLCHGFRLPGRGECFADGVGPGALGVESFCPNANVATLKSSIWHDLLRLLGKDGDKIMLDLILHCGIFKPIESGDGNLVQVSGKRISWMLVAELISSLGTPLTAQLMLDQAESSDPNPNPSTGLAATKPPASKGPAQRRRSSRLVDIFFVRSRMMYARPAFDAHGRVRLGLPHVRKYNALFNRVVLRPERCTQ